MSLREHGDSTGRGQNTSRVAALFSQQAMADYLNIKLNYSAKTGGKYVKVAERGYYRCIGFVKAYVGISGCLGRVAGFMGKLSGIHSS